MVEHSEEDILKELNNIFIKCDVEGSGMVEINTLIDIITSQEPTWQGNEAIKEKFRKLLFCSKSTGMITKEQFINSLLDESKSSSHTEREDYTEEVCFGENDGKYFSSSSGIGELSVDTSPRSINSNEGNYSTVYFVSDRQTWTNEDLSDGISVANSESPPAYTRLVPSLKEKINILQRKIEDLESSNSSLVIQVSSLEEIITKKEREAAVHLKKLEETNKLLEEYKEKEEKSNVKQHWVMEENKSLIIQLSQNEKESTKMKEFISKLEKEISSSCNEKVSQDKKIQNLRDKINMLSELNSKYQEELESLKIKEITEKEAHEKIMDENTTLRSQLEYSTILVQFQDLKPQLTHRELSDLQNAKLKTKLHVNNCVKDNSDDNSRTSFELDQLSLDNTIPYETSLLAELQEKIPPTENSHYCECLKKSPFPYSSPVFVGSELCTSDVAVQTDEKVFTNSSTMTYHELKVMAWRRRILSIIGLYKERDMVTSLDTLNSTMVGK